MSACAVMGRTLIAPVRKTGVSSGPGASPRWAIHALTAAQPPFMA